MLQGVLSKLGAAKELMREVIERERKKAEERNKAKAEVRRSIIIARKTVFW